MLPRKFNNIVFYSLFGTRFIAILLIFYLKSVNSIDYGELAKILGVLIVLPIPIRETFNFFNKIYSKEEAKEKVKLIPKRIRNFIFFIISVYCITLMVFILHYLKWRIFPSITTNLTILVAIEGIFGYLINPSVQRAKETLENA